MPGVFFYYKCANCGKKKRLRSSSDLEEMKKKMNCCEDPDPQKFNEMSSFYYSDTCNWAEDNITDKIKEHQYNIAQQTERLKKKLVEERDERFVADPGYSFGNKPND